MKVGINIAKGLVVAGLLVWIVGSGYLEFAALRAAFGSAGWMLGGIAAVGTVTLFSTLRWRALLAAQRIRLGYRDSGRLTLIGMFFSTVIPGGFTGDLVKVYYLAAKHPARKSAVLLSILADRVLGLIGLILMSAALLALRYFDAEARTHLQPLAGMVGLLVLGMAAGLPMVLSDRIRNHRVTLGVLAKLPFSGVVNRLYDALHVFKTAPAKVRDATLFSLAVALLNAVAFYCFGRALGNEALGLVDYAVVIPLILLAVTIPIAPAGIGVGQAAALVLFQRLGGVEKAFGANVMTLYQFGILVFAFVGAVLFIFYRKRHPAPS